MQFCKDFNAKTADFKEDVPLRVMVKVYQDKTYDWELKMPPASWFIKKAAGLQRGADRPGHEAVSTISMKHLYEIAKVKARDMPGVPMPGIVKCLMTTCRSMGVNIVGRPEEA
jgi:large subunit ribosomal protein L11